MNKPVIDTSKFSDGQNRFLEAYVVELVKEVQKNPQEYVWPVEQAREVAIRMVKSMPTGGFGMSNPIRRACRKLGIKDTIKAIMEYTKTTEKTERKEMNNKNMFAITKPCQDMPGTRVLAFSNQGRNHYDSRELAEEKMKELISNNSPERLKELGLDDLRVDSIECYHHGDAVGIYVDQ